MTLEVIGTEIDGGVLAVTCRGVHGIGSAGNPSAMVLHDAIADALRDAPAHPTSLIIDFTAVDYEWGDGPVSAVAPFLDRFDSIHYIASETNRTPLTRLVEECGWTELIEVGTG